MRREKMGKFLAIIGLGGVVLFFLTSCASVEKGISVLGQKTKISSEDAKSLVQVAQAFRSSFADITEEEEYYIGRSVAANVLSQYKVYKKTPITKYVNQIGQGVVLYSDRPEIYAGYHFLVLDSDEINALAAPGGFVFITKGLLRLCRNEDMLAAVLAHEVGHVAAKHGLRSIKKSRLVEAFRLLASETAQRSGSANLAKLVSTYENILGDITATLIERGYDRKFETEADALAVKFMTRAGYSPHALSDFLAALASSSQASSGKGWFKTHPSPEKRLAKVSATIKALPQVPAVAKVRTQRFRQYSSRLK
ncbi:MAG: hypothetical protein B5M54_09570 [Candidatus Aminicenantes bacterium 4484_214]|nr:MAG: hypothetical protein B5M54_09570 [Candidatus Aminicenantes bacterium 4484_214]